MVPLLEEESELIAGRDFHVGYSPERIDPGNTEWRLENTPKVVSGIDLPSLEPVTSFTTTSWSGRWLCPAPAWRTHQALGTPSATSTSLWSTSAMFASDPASTSGRPSTRRRQSSSLHRFVPGPGLVATVSHRPSTSRGKSGAASASRSVSSSWQQRQRAHARLRRPAPHPGLRRAGRSIKARASCSWDGLQVAIRVTRVKHGNGHRPVAGRPGRRPADGRSPPGRRRSGLPTRRGHAGRLAAADAACS